MLPNEVNGVEVPEGRASTARPSRAASRSARATTTLATFLSDNGKTLRDVKVAVASPTDSSSGAGTVVMAIQVEGVSEDKLLAWAAEHHGPSAEKTTVGGKEVYGAGAAGFGAYVYVKDDVDLLRPLDRGRRRPSPRGSSQQLP